MIYNTPSMAHITRLLIYTSLALCILGGCTGNILAAKNPCEESNVFPNNIITVEYDIDSSIGEERSNAVLIEAPNHFNDMELTGISLTRIVDQKIVVRLQNIESQNNDQSLSIFFADDGWLDGSFCVRATYRDDGGESTMMHPIFKKLILQK